MEGCPFCDLAGREVIAENELAVAIADACAVTKGHALVVTRDHVATWFDADEHQRLAMLRLVDVVRTHLEARYAPDGYNVGLNVGAAAGQTIMHLHLHVIPRRKGDVDDPTGGVRLVIPARGNYRRPGFVPTARGAPLSTGTREDPFCEHVRPLFGRAQSACIVAAFVADSGVRLLQEPLSWMIQRGGSVRVLTGDYLHFTQARALRNLLALRSGLVAAAAEEEISPGQLELRVVEVARLAELATSFHPKAWIFRGGDTDAAFVGSSNMTRTALHDGVEWNLRIERGLDPLGFDALEHAFDGWWQQATPVDDAWLEDYASRARASPAPLPLAETDDERVDPPDPWPIQQEALDALRQGRSEGRDRALVVLATGLGKTWLSAFDVQQFVEERPGAPFPRVLFLAHRAELLRQAAATYHRMFPDVRLSWCAGDDGDTTGDIVLASVQKLGRNLARLDRAAFQYIVVDEVHHADADTYRRILSHLDSSFRLGLTATPERADAGDVFGLFDDHLAFEADIGRGVATGALVPFAYYGLKDVVEYTPWQGRSRFDREDLEELSHAVQTEQRMQSVWRGWQEHAARRTLVFCCTIAHADYTARWLAGRGVRAVSVHSGPHSGDRFEAVADLGSGDIDAICTVDLFNEGVDIPAIDRVVMLRPTESPVVFLQQLGRGLRTSSDKDRLTAIDFVGNHRVFLDRVRTLLSLAPAAERLSLRACLESGRPLQLGNGCTVELELEAVELLRKMMPSGDRDVLLQTYRELRNARPERPTIGELYRMGFNPRSIKAPGGWFGLLRDEGDLDEGELAVLRDHGEWLFHLERDARTQKSFKLVTLEALIEAERLHAGMSTEELARRSRAIIRRCPQLMRDVAGVRELGDDLDTLPHGRWHRYWLKNPGHHWKPWFRVVGGTFVPSWNVTPSLQSTFARMTRELLDYRLARYRRDADARSRHGGFVCKVISNQRAPILMLPDRQRHPEVPLGDLDVRIDDGSYWRLRFVKIACNVAHRVGRSDNELPDLLRRWFGPNAGRPGTAFTVRFTHTAGTWWAEPVHEHGAEPIPLAAPRKLVAFPTLEAAAGLGGRSVHPLVEEAEQVALPLPRGPEGLFAVRASGASMQGWRTEIRSGDWLVLKWSQGAGIGAVEGRIALVARGAADEGQSFHIKRVLKRGQRYVLASDNPDVPDSPATAADTVVATVVHHVRPEALAPEVGTMLDDGEVAAAFHVGTAPSPPAERVDGHLFILLDGGGATLAEPDRVKLDGVAPRPAETAFVLAKTDRWRYCGVGRWLGEERAWAIPAVDFTTWRALGRGRSASHRLDEAWTERARELVSRLLVDPGRGQWIESRGQRCRIVSEAAEGGLRIDGGEGGFRPRTVSLVDLGWVLHARDELTGIGLDEPSVNRFRYLAGTPKGSTRYIDTGWAIVLVEHEDGGRDPAITIPPP